MDASNKRKRRRVDVSSIAQLTRLRRLYIAQTQIQIPSDTQRLLALRLPASRHIMAISLLIAVDSGERARIAVVQRLAGHDQRAVGRQRHVAPCGCAPNWGVGAALGRDRVDSFVGTNETRSIGQDHVANHLFRVRCPAPPRRGLWLHQRVEFAAVGTRQVNAPATNSGVVEQVVELRETKAPIPVDQLTS
jgi:hypothetical protein